MYSCKLIPGPILNAKFMLSTHSTKVTHIFLLTRRRLHTHTHTHTMPIHIPFYPIQTDSLTSQAKPSPPPPSIQHNSRTPHHFNPKSPTKQAQPTFPHQSPPHPIGRNLLSCGSSHLIYPLLYSLRNVYTEQYSNFLQWYAQAVVTLYTAQHACYPYALVFPISSERQSRASSRMVREI